VRQSTTNSIATDGQLFRTALQWTITFAVVLWIIKIIEVTFDLNFSHFDVYPGTSEGLAGILFAPLIHGSWSHLASNTMPLIVLGTALLCGYSKAAKLTLPILHLNPEIGVWLFSRHSFHFGASGLTFGMMSFCLHPRRNLLGPPGDRVVDDSVFLIRRYDLGDLSARPRYFFRNAFLRSGTRPVAGNYV